MKSLNKRVFTDLNKATHIALVYSGITNRIHRVVAIRGVYMVKKTNIKLPPLPSISESLEMDQKRNEGLITEDEYTTFYDNTFGRRERVDDYITRYLEMRNVI